LGLRVGERNALVVGAGGAAKAVVDVLLREGAHVQLTNRTAARAKVLADSFDHRIEVLPAEDLTRKGPWDLLVNATPAGTKGVHDDEQVRSEEHTSELQSRFDLVCRLLLEKKKKR